MAKGPMTGFEWFTVPQTARILGVSRQTIYEAVQTGRVKANNEGWSRRIYGEEIVKYALRTGRNIQDVAERMQDEQDNQISWKQVGGWAIAAAGLVWLLRKMDE